MNDQIKEMARALLHSCQADGSIDRSLAMSVANYILKDQWRDISTAPIDTPVLVYDGKSKWAAVYVAKKWNVGDNIYWPSIGSDGPECENSFDDKDLTHWQPLPEPPKE